MRQELLESPLQACIDQAQLRREQAEQDLRCYNLGILALSSQQQRSIEQLLGPNALQGALVTDVTAV